MTLPVFETFASVLLVSALSITGIVALTISDKFLKWLLVPLVSFSAGALFGDVFYHLLPEIVEAQNSFTIATATAIITGILIFFILEKFLHWHHHHSTHGKHHQHEEHCLSSYAKMNLIGDALHNFIDGAIIAGSYIISTPLGIATTLAVFFHEVPQELGDFGVLLHGGYTKGKALLMNFLSALTAIIGAGAVLLYSENQEVLAFLVPFTAGGFLYIAGSDLLPELRKELGIKKTLLQFIALALGIGIMRLLLYLE